MYYKPFYIFIRTNHEPRHRGAIVDSSQVGILCIGERSAQCELARQLIKTHAGKTIIPVVHK